MLASEIEKAVSDGENQATDISEVAMDLVSGFKLVQERSRGIFSFSYENLQAYYGVEFTLTFKRAAGDVERQVSVRDDGKISVGKENYSGDVKYDASGNAYYPGSDKGVIRAISMAAQITKELLRLRDMQQETPAALAQNKPAAAQLPPDDLMDTLHQMQEHLGNGDENLLSAQEAQAAALAGFKDAEAEITQDKRVGKGLIGGLDFIRSQVAGFSYTPAYNDDGGATITASIPKGRDIVIDVSPDGAMNVDGTVFDATKDNIKQILQLIAKEARTAQFRPAAAAPARPGAGV